jgi:hypothetical protein
LKQAVREHTSAKISAMDNTRFVFMFFVLSALIKIQKDKIKAPLHEARKSKVSKTA